MKFCSACGSTIELQIPVTDDRERHVCSACGIIHYINPRIIVCAIPAWEDKVLLCRRSIEPRSGYWTLPGGFMETGETTQQAAARETLEEACAHIEVHELYSLFNVTHIDQVHLFFRATMSDPDFAPGPESLEVALFSADEVPWNDIAFPAVSITLKQYFQEYQAGNYSLKLADVVINPDNTRLIRTHNFTHDST